MTCEKCGAEVHPHIWTDGKPALFGGPASEDFDGICEAHSC